MTDLVIVGRIRRAHGIRGEVVVEVMTESPDAIFAPGARVLAGTASGDPAPDGSVLQVESARPFADTLLVAFEEIPDRTVAERWRDRFLLVPQAEVEPPAPDEIFVHQLPGLTVMTTSGEQVGRILGTFEVAGRLLLEVARTNGTVLLPYELPFVDRVDLSQGTLVMRLPDGLLE